MYKLLLCWRYLRTRYLAMVCIVSVMLGVATLIVVNSVMSGFSTKLRERLHKFNSDIVVESWDYEGFPDAAGKIARIQSDPFLNQRIEKMTPTMQIFAMIQFRYQDTPICKTVQLIGVDANGRVESEGFVEHLVHKKDSADKAFELTEEGRRRHSLNQQSRMRLQEFPAPPPQPGEKPEPDAPPSSPHSPQGAVVGYAIATIRKPNAKAEDKEKDIVLLHEGDEVILTTISGAKLSPVFDRFVVTDYFKSEMSEYDSNYVFVPLEHLQKLRTMENRVTGIQIKLKNYDQDSKAVKERLADLFKNLPVQVLTWEDKQGPLLAAISIEKGILNVLLFLIIAVAGFGILAIFSMIVIEKTRDIGILKALGASNGGVMNIFLSYGLLLGFVGAGFGTLIGLLFTWKINGIEQWLAWLTGQEIFDRKIYYFSEIPTHIDAKSIVLVNVGAIGIAVLFSVLPALRAAFLHPVRALRYE